MSASTPAVSVDQMCRELIISWCWHSTAAEHQAKVAEHVLVAATEHVRSLFRPELPRRSSTVSL